MLTTTSSDGTVIAYDRLGEGPPLVLVSGAFGYRKFPQIEKLAQMLSQQFTVYNYDRRGRGDSSDRAPYSVEREIEDLDAMIDTCSGHAFVFGLSSGAVLSLEAAARLGRKISRLAVYQPPYVTDQQKTPERRTLLTELDQLLDEEERGAAVKLFMTRAFGMPGPLVTAFKITPMWSKLTGLAHTIPYDVALLDENWQSGKLPTEILSAVDAPTLVLAGGKSPADVRNLAPVLCAALPRGTTQVVAGQAHNVMAKALAPVLAGFFGARDVTA